jgi:rubrerythrin
MSDSQEKKPVEPDSDGFKKKASRATDFMASGKETLETIFRTAKREIVGTGDVSQAQAEKLRSFLRRDFATHAENFRKSGAQVKSCLSPRNLSVSLRSSFARKMKNMATTFAKTAEKSEKNLEYVTGEEAGPGTLICKECGATMKFTSKKRIPPCPKCHKTLFRISF